MSKVSKERAQRLAKFTDADAEYRETGSHDALRRRHEAALEGSPEDAARAGEKMATAAWEEGENRRDRLKKAHFSGWKRK